MIVWTFLRPFLGPLLMAGGALLVASSLWFGHKHEVKNAYKRGEAATLAKWEEADRVAQAVGKETSRLLVRSRDVIQEKLDGKLQVARKIASNNAMELSRVRSALDELSAAQTPGDNSCPSGGGDGERIRVVLPILAEGPDLVQEAHGLLERCTARLTALQEWSLTVRAANPE